MLTIRPARTTEADALSALAFRSKAHWGYSAEFMAACRAELTVHVGDIRAGRVLVAESDSALLGFYCLAEPRDGRAELDALFVDPAAIGRGVGRTLLREAVTQARARGALIVEIQADPHAEAFYVRAGARRIGERASGSIPGRLLPMLEIAVHVAESAS
jgi:GNAT superfamily N-acetyltransferase